MHKIEVDDEVFALLQQLAVPFVDTPNSVLRRELLGPERGKPSENSASKSADLSPAARLHSRTGELMPFITSGRIEPDDILIYTKRNGESFRATVTNDGWIKINGNTYFSPSGALKACVGHDVNGWKTWTHERTNQLLDTFRK
ncbi:MULTISPECIES: hypothetical protein [Rhodococcus]|uniref:restriction system modified-DNA reader domain-containing protein n=1 Tax=Rhodococcus TaxID=1827 RepID=UPI0005756525|nr:MULTISPECIES: hypothetical protein [Rhodococcus]KHJ74585.1 hypothetical protein QR64_00750 [Rhodococcus sp. Chr-9]WKK14786.1 hypothetical protein QYN14_26450 [Rhodococcus ruber]